MSAYAKFSAALLQWSHRLLAMETTDEFCNSRRAAFLQWSHHLPAMETRCSSRRSSVFRPFNGATAFRRWKQGWPSLQFPQSSPFNGATAFWRWKLHRPRWSAGRSPLFNGATAFRRWKPEMSAYAKFSAALLQWTHRLPAMETPRLGHHPGRHLVPSMEPPPSGDGNVQVGLGRAPDFIPSLEDPRAWLFIT